MDKRIIYLVKREVSSRILRLAPFLGADATHWGLHVGNKCYQLLPQKKCIVLELGDYDDRDWKSKIHVGETLLSDHDIEERAHKAFDMMSDKYNVLENNCQHFVILLVAKLYVTKEALSQMISQHGSAASASLVEAFERMQLNWLHIIPVLKQIFHRRRHHHDHNDREIQTSQHQFKSQPNQDTSFHSPTNQHPDFGNDYVQGQTYGSHINHPPQVATVPQHNPGGSGYLETSPPLHYAAPGFHPDRRATLPANFVVYQMPVAQTNAPVYNYPDYQHHHADWGFHRQPVHQNTVAY